MSRPSIKKLCLLTFLSLAGIVFIFCVQSRKLQVSQKHSNIGNNANTRKLREEEHFNSIRTAIDNVEYGRTKENEAIRKYENAKTKDNIENIITKKEDEDKALHSTSTSEEGARDNVSNQFSNHHPWYMENGDLWPWNISGQGTHLLSEDLPNTSDRVAEQLMYLPPKGYVPENIQESEVPLKKILLWNGASSWGALKPGRGVFLKEKCPVSSCVLSSSRTEADSADLVIFKDHFTMPTFKRPLHQKWMLYLLECPLHTQMFKYPSVFNWTATYRRDSTIVAPYEYWQYYNNKVRTKPQEKNYASNKTKQVAWFVSNCGARNGRLAYARELGKYINVDIFGACGPNRCPRTNSNKCFQLLDDDYKFYLAFENSNCKDYITEKFFVNGLGHNILPIAMGARLEDYEKAAPYKSFLHVDQFSGPEQLAKFLHKLDQDDNLYNEYFKWKGTGEFVNTKFWCRVCSQLHNEQELKGSNNWYSDINEWWRGDGVCSNQGWKPGVTWVNKKSRNQVDEPQSNTEKTWRYEEPKSSKERSKILMGA